MGAMTKNILGSPTDSEQRKQQPETRPQLHCQCWGWGLQSRKRQRGLQLSLPPDIPLRGKLRSRLPLPGLWGEWGWVGALDPMEKVGARNKEDKPDFASDLNVIHV